MEKERDEKKEVSGKETQLRAWRLMYPWDSKDINVNIVEDAHVERKGNNF